MDHPRACPSLVEQQTESLSEGYILPGLKAGSVGAVIGPHGVGKSYWLLNLCAALSGNPQRNASRLAVSPGRVVILSASDSADMWELRVGLFGAEVMPSLSTEKREALWDHVEFHSFCSEEPDIMDDAWFEKIGRDSEAGRLIVLGSLAGFHRLRGAHESDMARQLVARLESLAQATGAAVLFTQAPDAKSTTSSWEWGRGEEGNREAERPTRRGCETPRPCRVRKMGKLQAAIVKDSRQIFRPVP